MSKMTALIIALLFLMLVRIVREGGHEPTSSRILGEALHALSRALSTQK
jgi:hypothetical protein